MVEEKDRGGRWREKKNRLTGEQRIKIPPVREWKRCDGRLLNHEIKIGEAGAQMAGVIGDNCSQMGPSSEGGNR